MAEESSAMDLDDQPGMATGESLASLLDATAHTQYSLSSGLSERGRQASEPPRTASTMPYVAPARRRTNSADDMPVVIEEEVPESVVRLQQKIIRHLHARFKKAGIEVSVDASRLAWLLPTTVDDAAAWDQLLSDPLTLDDGSLQRILNLEDSYPEAGAGDPADGELRIAFYVKTWCLTIGELYHILHEMKKNGYDYFTKLDEWYTKLTTLLRRPGVTADDMVYLRYAGQTRENANRRDAQDGSGLGLDYSAFIGYFVAITRDLYPEIHENRLLQDVIGADVTLSAGLGVQTMADYREKILIALIWDAGLNSAFGGRQPAFTPHMEVERSFYSLAVSVVQQSRKLPQASSVVRDKIRTYATKCQTYANSNMHTTGTNKEPYSDKLVNAITAEAHPKNISPHAGSQMSPFLLVGPDKPLQKLANCDPFFDEDHPTTEALANVFARFISWETGAPFDPSVTRRLAHEGLFPLIDVYQWAGKDRKNLVPALDLTCEYLKIVNPVVIMTMGKYAARCALDNFENQCGIASTDPFYKHVGKPVLRRYEGLTAEQRARASRRLRSAAARKALDDRQATDEYWVVVIPNYHPGSLGWSSTSESLEAAGTIQTLISAKAWLALHLAMNLSRGNFAKKQICEEVICRVNALTGAGTPFDVMLQAAIEANRKIQSQKHTTGITHEELNQANSKLFRRRLNVAAADQSLASALATTNPSARHMFALSHRSGTFQSKTRADLWEEAWLEMSAILDMDWAVGLPGSDERRAQVQNLLEIYNTFKDIPEKQFMAWAVSISEGRNYFCELATPTVWNELCVRLQQTEAINKTPCPEDPAFLDEDIEFRLNLNDRLKAWIKDVTTGLHPDQLRPAVDVAWQARMALIDPEYYRVQLEAQQHAMPDTIFAYDIKSNPMHAQPILVVPGTQGTAVLKLAWSTDKGTHHLDLIVSAQVLPSYVEDRRFIHFSPTGIDLVDPKHHIKGIHSNQQHTLPLSELHYQIDAMPNGQAFWELFASQTEYQESLRQAREAEEDKATDSSLAHPNSYYKGTPRRLETKVLGTAFKTQDKYREAAKPLRPADGVFLLEQFLRSQYPQGGIIVAANPIASPELAEVSVWTHLARFDWTPYRNHPCYDEMMDLVQRGQQPPTRKASVNRVLAAALRWLRPGISADTDHSPRYTIEAAAPVGLLDFP